MKRLRNNKGIALIMAIAALTLMMYIAMEVMYDSQVEYIVHSQQINRIKAYYAARSGVEISLLRLKLYQTIVSKFGKNLPADGMVDQIWKFPFMWPLEIPGDINAVDTDIIKNAVKESTMDATFSTEITDEGGLIDLNDLNSPSKTLREVTQKQILQIFENKLKDDEDFQRRYSGYKFNELVNHIADWMTNKSASLNGGDKRSYFQNLGQDGPEKFPPNRGFRTVAELRLVQGMTDEFYNILQPQVTIYGMKGINPNTADKVVLRALDPGITDEIVEEIVKRREDPEQGGPFKDAKDFWSFVEGKGARLLNNTEQIPIVTSGLFAFRINSIGTYGKASREIEVVVLDLEQAATKLSEAVKNDQPGANPGANPGATGGANPAPGPGSGGNASPALPKGPPRIVYWTER